MEPLDLAKLQGASEERDDLLRQGYSRTFSGEGRVIYDARNGDATFAYEIRS